MARKKHDEYVYFCRDKQVQYIPLPEVELRLFHYDQLMEKTIEETKLREEYPILKQKWEEYNVLLNLLKD